MHNENEDDCNLYKVQVSNRVNFGFWKDCGIITIALLLAKLSLPSINYSNPFSFIALVAMIWLLNMIMRPLLIIFTLPFIFITLGIGIIFVDALVIWVATFIPGIEFKSYWAALWAGFIIETLSWIFAIAESKKVFKHKKQDISQRDKDDAIDV